jgi:hypothetical protein
MHLLRADVLKAARCLRLALEVAGGVPITIQPEAGF